MGGYYAQISRYSLDVTFDEEFLSIGPRRHFASKDALPVSIASDVPHIDSFVATVPIDDHYGVPLQEYQEYQEDHTTDGYHISSTDPLVTVTRMCRLWRS